MSSPDLPADLQLDILPYPLETATQQELIDLLRTEWTGTDYDWSAAMRGDYSAHLAITTVLGRHRGTPLVTATVHFARRRPEVAVIGNVLTLRQYRDQGLAGRVIEAALALARAAGCQVCLLGTARNPHNVYLHHGFTWVNGTVMRRPFGAGEFERACFTPGQPVTIRAAHWGDLPGVTLLAAQPIASFWLDEPRGLRSGLYHPAERCLSNFPVLWYATAAAGGAMFVVAGTDDSRVFGLGSVTVSTTPQGASAVVEFAAHDNYAAQLPALLDCLLQDCRTRGLGHAEARVAAGDDTKLACLRAAGFACTREPPSAQSPDGKPTGVRRFVRPL